MIDYKRTNVAIEAFYILIPLFVSLIVMILMACHYGIGAQFMPSGFVATAVRFQHLEIKPFLGTLFQLISKNSMTYRCFKISLLVYLSCQLFFSCHHSDKIIGRNRNSFLHILIYQRFWQATY